jgi:hypothetical protein
VTWPDRRTLRLIGILGLIGFGGAMAACGDRAAPTPGASSAAAALSPTTAASTTAVPMAATPTPPLVLGSPSLQPIVVDPTLLSILPASVDGISMQAASDTATRMTQDPALAASTSALEVGAVIAAGSSRTEDLAVASVIHLRPGVYTDAFYAAWRREYDEAACAPAGGVLSRSQQVIGVRSVAVTVCSQGARTYQTYLGGDVLVSVTSVGDRRLGERVMAGLRQ